MLVYTRLAEQYYRCGGVWIDSDHECKCGSDQVLTEKEDENKRTCCGPDTCFVDEAGDGVCPDGIPCDTSEYGPWNCGDVLIATEKNCQCGSQTLNSDQYYNDDTWCCPSHPGQCSYQEDGSAVCHNSTVVTGRDNGCNGPVCWSRYRLPCKSGNQCVRKYDICHGQPQCDDESDLDQCGPENNDLCPPSYYYSKCSADLPHHEECYDTSEGTTNNQEYDCLNRGDESGQTPEQIVDYDSITECDYHDGRPGLMCGSECLPVEKWCDPEASSEIFNRDCDDLVFCTETVALTCSTGEDKTFTADNPSLCQNTTFWQSKTCGENRRGEVGRRCTGQQQRCVYGADSCPDKSDQIFSLKTICSEINGNHEECKCSDKTETDSEPYFECPINGEQWLQFFLPVSSFTNYSRAPSEN